MRLVKVTAVLMLLSLSIGAKAGGTISFEEAQCVNSIQHWFLSWNFTAPHDDWDDYVAWTKIAIIETEYQQSYGSSPNNVHCVPINDGTPRGAYTHNWKVTAEKGSSTYDSNVENLGNAIACDNDPL